MFSLRLLALYAAGLTVMIKVDQWQSILGYSAVWFALLLTGTTLITGACVLLVADIAQNLKIFTKEEL